MQSLATVDSREGQEYEAPLSGVIVPLRGWRLNVAINVATHRRTK